jgi:hypothetical protein
MARISRSTSLREEEDFMRSAFLAVTAAALVSAGASLSAARAADLYPEAPPRAAEAPPPEVAPPPVAVVRPPAVVLVEPECPVVWRCGYWGCGWRRACAAVGPEIHARPWGYYGYGAYRTYHGPYWGHGQRWGHWRHWS